MIELTSFENIGTAQNSSLDANIRKSCKIKEIPISSSLALQISLFANVYVYPVWIASSMFYFYTHSLGLNDTFERVLAVIFFAIATPLEAGRLYLGYSGNLREKIPDFAGFLILSTFIQLPIQIFYSYIIYKMKSMSLQFVIQFMITILILSQILIGYNAMRGMTTLKAQQFHIECLIKQCNRNENKEKLS